MGELAYCGKIVQVDEIPTAEKVKLATAVCGKGGRWRGVVPNADAIVGLQVVVFLPDALLPADNPLFAFMERHRYRVKQRKFLGVPSEALILNAMECGAIGASVGDDLTDYLKVTKYEKPGFKGSWETGGGLPPFIRRTDEPNFQKVPEMVEAMRQQSVYVTLKYDGMSCTAFRKNDEFFVCSRNLIVKEGDNPFWKVARQHGLDKSIPNNLAVQFEVFGEGIQGNPLGIVGVDGRLFNMWDITDRKYLSLYLQPEKPMPTVKLLGVFEPESQPADWQEYASQVKYDNGKPAEGIVVRPCLEKFGMVDGEFQRFSFKVINLNYKD